ncbi:ribonuclease P protein component [Nocardioides aurantiacus]|uniref:Ribonuclease P protein component n=1 Tax=Nocardioides aurantiacus TaxID=86796 RepID=A0A3N2CZL2_9ACTN|nr:ribonuclease P protein component [Nocardioides aurantiacus]ROR92926.1 ribonuclease P protein component [Nocardioides aurantiacus]
MLPSSQRLTAPEQFRAVVRRGRRSGGPVMVVHLLVPDSGAVLATPRAGFVVSKAVGNAVTRNLVKRRLRHLVADRVDRLPDHALLVVRALPAAAEASYDVLGRELDRGLARCLPQAAPA